MQAAICRVRMGPAGEAPGHLPDDRFLQRGSRRALAHDLLHAVMYTVRPGADKLLDESSNQLSTTDMCHSSSIRIPVVCSFQFKRSKYVRIECRCLLLAAMKWWCRHALVGLVELVDVSLRIYHLDKIYLDGQAGHRGF